jgi:hypothetical protein
MPVQNRKFVLKAGWKSTTIPEVGMVHPGRVLVGEQFAKYLPNILVEVFDTSGPDTSTAQGAVPGEGAATPVAAPPPAPVAAVNPPAVIVPPPPPPPVPPPAPVAEEAPEPEAEAPAEEEATPTKPQTRKRKRG